MCKNEGSPCPGCKKHKTSEAVWMFFSEEERQALKVLRKTEPPVRAAAHP